MAAFDEAARIPTLTETEADMEVAEDGEDKPKKKVRPVMGLRELLDGLIPYSERHFARVDRLVQDSYVLDYVVGEMDGGMFGGEVMDVDL